MADLTAWRLTHERYARSAFSGEGIHRHGVRFNSPGIPIVYTSEILALALLETQQIGDRRASQEDAVALRVPSVVVPYSRNYLLNPPTRRSRRLGLDRGRPCPWIGD